ncbi:MAG: aspartate kinase [Rickettsiales bacterium TMED289]|nr:MAG: aspartate kinase [Rickettsiales bacterium TMED289]|tara:strand:- start:534 stop:1739 length:1206 start_codon:yes stop_codon:yes gene_type:complete
MKIVVLKFGGTSVGTIKRIKSVARTIAGYYKKNYRVIVVSSAMSGVTNGLIKQANSISINFNKSEYDVLVSSGEQISCSLIAGALTQLGYKSKSFMGWQIPLITDSNHTDARILNIPTRQIKNFVNSGGIPIIAGFQGITINKRISTLGRGASDYTAIMVAKFFKAKKCIIYTDVSGVMTTDPKVFKKAKKIKVISYEEMLEMSSLGSKVMQSNSVQDARLNRVDVNVMSSFTNKNGTLITKKNHLNKKIITGISSTRNDSKISLIGVKDKPGVAASIFEPLSKNDINVDMVVQNISSNGVNTDITFTIKSNYVHKTQRLLKENKKIKFKKILVDNEVSKVSIIGVGMISTPGVTYRMFKSLSKKKINILVISTSEIKISVLINRRNTKKAVIALHKEFKL